MTLDEAIKHAEEVAKQNEEDAIIYSNCKNHKKNLYEIGLAENAEKKCCKCAEEHRQLAEWLKELKQLREQVSNSEKPNKWIPVSEKLPEEDGRFLTYIENPYNSQLSYIMVCDYINKDWCPDDDTASDNVVAWMPLLESYKG